MKPLPLAALLLALPAASLAAQTGGPGGTARITVSARVVPVETAQRSARLVRRTLAAPLSSERTTRRQGLLWISMDPPRKGARRVTVNYLAN